MLLFYYCFIVDMPPTVARHLRTPRISLNGFSDSNWMAYLSKKSSATDEIREVSSG